MKQKACKYKKTDFCWYPEEANCYRCERYIFLSAYRKLIKADYKSHLIFSSKFKVDVMDFEEISKAVLRLLNYFRKFRLKVKKEHGIWIECYAIVDVTDADDKYDGYLHLHVLVPDASFDGYKKKLRTIWMSISGSYIVIFLPVKNKEHHRNLATYFANKKNRVSAGYKKRNCIVSHNFYDTRKAMRSHSDALKKVVSAFRLLLEKPGNEVPLFVWQIQEACCMKDDKRLGGKYGYISQLIELSFIGRKKPGHTRRYIYYLRDESDYKPMLKELFV